MAVFRLTGIPAYELTNRHLDATSIFKNVQFTFEKLQSAEDYTMLIHIVNHFAQELIYNSRKDVLPLDLISRKMMQSGGNISIDWLAKELCSLRLNSLILFCITF